jgi:microsomal dipeptidase-like Zn-dependent dipeptidase
VGSSLKDIKRVQDLGVTYITLCHTKNNDYCDSSSDTVARWNGLSKFGKKAIKEMNRRGMMIDVSHASEKTFWDVIKHSKKPIIASHSSSRALYDHDRNLTDDQIRAVAKNGGVVQVCIVNEFLRKNKKDACLDDFMNHLCHIIDVAGIDHVGIGTDFDGGGGVKGCRGDNDLIRITVKLIERGYSEEDIAKIWGGNFLRVMDEVQSL